MPNPDESSVEAEDRLSVALDSEGEVVAEFTDSEDEDSFVRKYGEIKFQYIRAPKLSVWFIRPHALNYFKDGVLYRTKGERTSSKTELFLDLMYVGLIANLAGEALEHASWGSFLQYLLIFIPYWTVWADIKDFTNYYYSEDMSQKTYILWILILLTLSVNSHEGMLHSRAGAAYTVVPYILCRLSLAISLLVYSFFIPEHRAQQRLYFGFLICTCCLWIPVIFVSTRGKIAVAFIAIAMEQITFCIVFHPGTKKVLKLTTSTALNIEHEDERLGTFVVIAIGEFLYKVVAEGTLGIGFTTAFWRSVLMLVIAYSLFWLYFNGGTTEKAVHPLRHSAFRAISWIYLHLPIVGGVVLAADAGGELLNRKSEFHVEETAHDLLRRAEEAVSEEPSLRALCFFFTGGIFVAVICIGLIGMLDECKDRFDHFVVPKFYRIVFRFPIAAIILVLPFAEMNITLLFGMVAMLLVLLYVYEAIVSTPRQLLFFGMFHQQLSR